MKAKVIEIYGSTIIRTYVKFGSNAGFGLKTNLDQKFKFNPNYSNNYVDYLIKKRTYELLSTYNSTIFLNGKLNVHQH